MSYEVKQLPGPPDDIAPDGLEVRLLPELAGGSLAHFTVPPERTGRAVTHRTVSEIWYVVDGAGEMWLADADGGEDVVAIGPGTAVSLPLGTRFQVRNTSSGPLTAVGVTMPPWPGRDEAVVVEGRWRPTVDG